MGVTTLFTFLLLCGVVFSCDTTTFQSQGYSFDRCADLDENFSLHWRVENSVVVFGMNIANLPRGAQFGKVGWFGFGLSEYGGMKGADMFIAQKGEHSSVVVEDRYAPTYTTPQADTHSDITVLHTSVDTTTTKVVFSRPLVSCDIEQDMDITDKQIFVIFAYGPNNIHYHGSSRGVHSINFITSSQPQQQQPNLLTHIIQPKSTTIPPTSVSLLCSAHVLPHDRKYHMVEAKFTTHSSIHHIKVYVCDSAPPVEIIDVPMPCYEMGYCQERIMWIGWTPGTLPLTLDDAVGSPIGEDRSSYIVVERHYNNPERVEGLVDNISNVALKYTPNLRPNDAGVMLLGAYTSFTLPPHNPHYIYENECVSGCTQYFGSNITIFAIMPHMHALGSKVVIRHIRDNVELEPILRVDHFDFSLQKLINVNHRVVLPGDRLITNCIYDTSSRDSPVYSGEDSSDEMCTIWVGYYPRMSIDVCSDLGNNRYQCGAKTVQESDDVILRKPYKSWVESQKC